MNHYSMFRRAVALVLIPVVVAGCSSWQLAKPTPSEYLQSHRPNHVRVTRSDSARISLRTPELRGDSLWGIEGGSLARADTGRQVIVPLSDIQRMEVRRFSLAKTLGLYAVISVALLIAFHASGGLFGDGIGLGG